MEAAVIQEAAGIKSKFKFAFVFFWKAEQRYIYFLIVIEDTKDFEWNYDRLAWGRKSSFPMRTFVIDC